MNFPNEKISVGDNDSDRNLSNKAALWYYDSLESSYGLQTGIKIRDVLCRYRSKWQEIVVFETEKLGKMLVLDGITMLTEFDEFAYHEMIVHVPLLTHPCPSKILVIGGGDGGTVREIVKHPEVESIHVCELDEEVVKACQKYIPSLASSFDDPRVDIFYEDGARFVAQKKGAYDIIIVDSTDPIGPGQILFQRPFYSDMKKALKKEGIAVTQCESMYLHREVISGVSSFASEIYPLVGYYFTLVPTYPSGIIGFLFNSLKWDPRKDFSPERAGKLTGLRYYSTDIHKAAFTLPRFGTQLLTGKQPTRT